MSSEYEMSMIGELKFFLGLKFKETPSSTFIHQQMYIKQLLIRFDTENFKTNDTLMAITTRLDLDEETKYRGMIGSYYTLLPAD